MREWTREKRLRTRSQNGTLALGETLVELLRAPKMVVLRGELGAGKTTLVKGMAAALGANADEVTSPTFTLVHEYAGKKTRLVHLDLYRLEREEEIEGQGVCRQGGSGDHPKQCRVAGRGHGRPYPVRDRRIEIARRGIGD